MGGGSPGPAAPSFFCLISALSEGSRDGGKVVVVLGVRLDVNMLVLNTSKRACFIKKLQIHVSGSEVGGRSFTIKAVFAPIKPFLGYKCEDIISSDTGSSGVNREPLRLV